MSLFKIAELVILNDSRRARIMENLGGRRWLVRVLDGELLDVAHGDLARPGEDHEIALREEWRESLGYPGAGLVGSLGNGNYVRMPSSGSDNEKRGERHHLGASPSERRAMGLDDL